MSEECEGVEFRVKRIINWFCWLTLNIELQVCHAGLAEAVVSGAHVVAGVVPGDGSEGHRKAADRVLASGHLSFFAEPVNFIVNTSLL